MRICSRFNGSICVVDDECFKSDVVITSPYLSFDEDTGKLLNGKKRMFLDHRRKIYGMYHISNKLKSNKYCLKCFFFPPVIHRGVRIIMRILFDFLSSCPKN